MIFKKIYSGDLGIFYFWKRIFYYLPLLSVLSQVLLHRLASFHRVWSFPPNENTGKEVTCLAWRPDGKRNDSIVKDTFLFFRRSIL